ncbi:helix-turn-helix domain-containing protein [Pandoraea norimbergensis]|uniref:helix-turn-helix domain-containing protein n=1 Tax=Pandoraea norimbergensis TaxID=93219 RepID=UPI000A06F072
MAHRCYEKLRQDLASNLKNLRKRAGLSQEQLSVRAHVDRSYVSQLEREIGNPSLQVLATLASTLGSDVVDLLTGQSD